METLTYLPSFRRRLLRKSGGILVMALGLAGLAAWLMAYVWINQMARLPLQNEAQLVAHVILQGGELQIEAYYWDEPHHRLLERHIDPFFLQVFDAKGRLLRQSDNIALLGAPYPQTLLHPPVAQEPFWQPLRTFRIGSHTLYYVVYPLYDAQQRYLGALQLARLEPGFLALYRQTALGIGLIWVVLSGLTLLLLALSSQRVLRPLHQLTQATAALSADRLHEPIRIQGPLDRETALLLSALNDLLRRLHEAFDELRRFTANASHELKTPLTILRGQAELALRRPRSAEHYRETLHNILRQTEHLTTLVEHLLLLSRLDQPETPFSFTPVDLSALVAQELEPFRARAATRGIALTASLDPKAQTMGVATLLKEVVRNVLDNALKYTPKGTIEVTVIRSGTQVVLEVRDTGVGIPPEALPHITERFYRVPSTAAGVEGHGLGLALVARIVTLHNGVLGFASQVGQGTIVRVTLPALAIAIPDPQPIDT